MKYFHKSISLSVVIAVSGIATMLPHTALAFDLNDAVRTSIQNNPEVMTKLHEFHGAGEDRNVARADFFPTVDLSYEANRQKFQYPDSPGSPVSQNYTTSGWTLSVTQNLFQGLQTYNQMKELGFDQQARYFDFLDETESMALQTVQAYADVLRYRQLVQVAKDNYAIHEGIFNQITEKVQAGVGRRVDLEQAAGRLALAETNLITDNSNLHDVSARFTRLTGKEPPAEMSAIPSFLDALPKNNDLMKVAVAHSPAYMSALSTVRSARSEVDVRRGAFSPTVNLQASKAPTENYDGYIGHTDQSSVAIIFAMNLFRGGADRARLGSASEKLNATLDQRDKVCRDMRQTLSIANDNVLKLSDQMPSLRQHELSTEKARDAYRKQFDIGQRTLLDVLDSENELFDAQRSYIIAQADYTIAQATVLGNSGRLLETLKLKPAEDFQVDRDLGAADQNACDTAYTPPPSLNINAIPAHSIATTTPADTNSPATPAPAVIWPH